MAILNLTPDSFSDGRPEASIQDFLEDAEQKMAAGAHILDIGGESTRPVSYGINPGVDAEEEKQRVLPFLKAFRKRHPNFPISLDTRKYEVALAAMPYGIHYLNDVSFLEDVRLAELAKHSGCHYVLMHTRGNPDQMDDLTNYGLDLFHTLKQEVQAKLQILADMGFPQEKLVLDPGFGFAKTPEQCQELMQNLAFWQQFECDLLLGISRKRFLSLHLGDVSPVEKDPLSAKLAADAVSQGFGILRVHNVQATREACLEKGFSLEMAIGASHN